MNSLTWLLAPRSNSFHLQHPLRHPSRHDSSNPTSLSDPSPSSSTTPLHHLGPGPRESESELVDEMVETVQRCSGFEAANTLERKASISCDGELRLGLPGITERRRNLNLNLDEDRLPFALQAANNEHPTSIEASVSQPLSDNSTIRSPILSSLASSASPTSPSRVSSIPTSDCTSSKPLPHFKLRLFSSPSVKTPSPELSKPTSFSDINQRQRSHRLARLLPVRLGVNLYILIRKFLSLFSLRLPPAYSDEPAVLETAPLLVTPPAPVTVQKTSPGSRQQTSARHRSLYSRLWRPTLRTPVIPIIVPDDEHTGSLVMTDASSSADDSDSTLSSSNPLPTPARSASLQPPPRLLSARGKRSKAASAPPPEPKPVLPGTRTKTLVLDLDETLIHSTSRLGGLGGGGGTLGGGGSGHAGLKVRVVEVVLDGRIVVYHVYKRPWVDFFLKTVRLSAGLRRHQHPTHEFQITSFLRFRAGIRSLSLPPRCENMRIQ